jgi:hypothetical protein
MNWTLFGIGLFLCIFSHPKVMGFVMKRLLNERLVPAKKVSREQGEIIRFAGPNLSLFFVGAILIVLSMVLKTR